MVEIIPKENQETSKQVSWSFYFIVSLLVFSIGCYFVLNSFLNKAKAETKHLETSLAEIMIPEKQALQREVLLLEGKINSYSILTKQHVGVSKVFVFFEENIHPQVLFSKIDLAVDKKQAQVFGTAQSFEILGQQIFIFKNKEKLETIVLNDLSINREGKIDFSLSFVFKPEIFYPQFLDDSFDDLENKFIDSDVEKEDSTVETENLNIDDINEKPESLEDDQEF